MAYISGHIACTLVSLIFGCWRRCVHDKVHRSKERQSCSWRWNKCIWEIASNAYYVAITVRVGLEQGEDEQGSQRRKAAVSLRLISSTGNCVRWCRRKKMVRFFLGEQAGIRRRIERLTRGGWRRRRREREEKEEHRREKQKWWRSRRTKKKERKRRRKSRSRTTEKEED